MKLHPRMAGKMTALIVFLLIIGVLALSSAQENRAVRAHFDALFRAVQAQDTEQVQTLLNATQIADNYRNQLFQFPLLGWKITRITGQPWPMEHVRLYNRVTADLYYDLPAQYVAPTGPYQRLQHPLLGECAVVPVTLEFSYKKELQQWFSRSPEKGSALNWIGPWKAFNHVK